MSDRTKYNWTATKIEACIKFDFNVGELPVEAAKQVLETDSFFVNTSRCLSEHSIEWLEAIGMTSDKALLDLSSGEVSAELHSVVIGLVYVAAATSVMRGHLGVAQAIRWGDLQLAKYGVFPDLDPDSDVSELVEMLDNPEDPETQELLAKVSDRKARAKKLTTAEETGLSSFFAAVKRIIKIGIWGAIAYCVLYLAVGLYVTNKERVDREAMRAEERARRDEAETLRKREAERVRLYATNHGDWQNISALPAGFGDLHGRVIEIDGLDYLQYRVVYSESHVVLAIPRAQHFTSYALWKADCTVGLQSVVKGEFGEANVKEINSWSREAEAELQCVQLGGDTWLMRYAIWPSAKNPGSWEENYGGFEVKVEFSSYGDRPGWNMGQGLRAAAVH